MNSTLQTYVTQVQRLLHDVSFSVWTVPEITDYINEAREDVALDMHCVRHNTVGVQLLQGQEVYSIDGAVCGANVTAGGTNYSSATTVVFDLPPPGGTPALGYPVITNGVVSSIIMTQWGQGYTSVPGIAISDPGGNAAVPAAPPPAPYTAGFGAAASAVCFINTFNIVGISNRWNNQRYTLGFRGFTMFQAYHRSQPNAYLSRPFKWTLHPQDLQVYIQHPPDQWYSSEWDVIATPFPLVNLTDIDREVRPPNNKAVKFRAASIGLMKKQNFAQSDYYEKKYEQRVPRIITTTGGIRIPNPYNRNFQRKISRGM
jgi:hypothetical protein